MFVQLVFIFAGLWTASLCSSAQTPENSKYPKIFWRREGLSFKRISSTTRNEISNHLGFFLILSSHDAKLFTQNFKGQDEFKRKTKGPQTTLIRSSKRLGIQWVFLETSWRLSRYDLLFLPGFQFLDNCNLHSEADFKEMVPRDLLFQKIHYKAMKRYVYRLH